MRQSVGARLDRVNEPVLPTALCQTATDPATRPLILSCSTSSNLSPNRHPSDAGLARTGILPSPPVHGLSLLERAAYRVGGPP